VFDEPRGEHNLSRGEEARFERGSGNVFRDLGLPNPEERLLKAGLAMRIANRIEALKLNQAAAATRLGVDQPKVSALLRGRLSGFSVERLFRFLASLGCDVVVSVGVAGLEEEAAQVRVVDKASPVPAAPSGEPAEGTKGGEAPATGLRLSRSLQERLSRLADEQGTSMEILAAELLATAAAQLEQGPPRVALGRGPRPRPCSLSMPGRERSARPPWSGDAA
jgi:predicted XRE-type DNA-binding protein